MFTGRNSGKGDISYFIDKYLHRISEMQTAERESFSKQRHQAWYLGKLLGLVNFCGQLRTILVANTNSSNTCADHRRRVFWDEPSQYKKKPFWVFFLIIQRRCWILWFADRGSETFIEVSLGRFWSPLVGSPLWQFVREWANKPRYIGS